MVTTARKVVEKARSVENFSTWVEFKKFLMRGNIVELAAAIIIGVAFGAIVKSFVDDIFMPPVGILLGDVDFSDLFVVLKQGATPGPYETIAAAKAAGAVTWRYGLFINTVINFVIIAFAVFLMLRFVIKLLRKEQAAAPVSPTTKDCPQCAMQVPLKANRCPYCTSEISMAESAAAKPAPVTVAGMEPRGNP